MSGGDQPYVIKQLAPGNLLLDPQNPRLPPNERGKGQERLLEIMLERFAIEEIAESICSAGFLPMDPFIGFDDGNKTVILEGNRRLATIKLLLTPTLAPERFARTWKAYAARLSNASRQMMSHLSVMVYHDRRNASVLSYIGYRHVNGVMSWEAEEKAAFIASLIEDKTVKWSYSDIANKLGSKPTYVEKLYVAHRLIEQAKEEQIPGHEIMRSQFGVLTRSLQSRGIPQFLGIEFPGDPTKSRRPATTSKRDLQDFVQWTFGTEDVKRILEDSRDLTKWGQTLASQESVRYLRTAKDPRFERAYAKSGGLKEGLVDSLLAASDALADAVPLVRQHKKEEDVQRGIERCTDYLSQILAHFPEIAQRQGVELRDAPTA